MDILGDIFGDVLVSLQSNSIGCLRWFLGGVFGDVLGDVLGDVFGNAFRHVVWWCFC